VFVRDALGFIGTPFLPHGLVSGSGGLYVSGIEVRITYDPNGPVDGLQGLTRNLKQ